MHFLPFMRTRSRQFALFGVLSASAAFGSWGCSATSTVGNGTAISGTEFAYVTNQTDNTVSAYSVDANAGTLTSIGTTNVGKSPTKIVSISLGTNKNYVYVMNTTDSTISQFKVNANGTLASLSTPTVPIGSVPSDMTLSGDGTPFTGFTSNGTDPTDNREFRLYVTTQKFLVRTFGINSDGTLSLKSDVHLNNVPRAVNVSGPDYPYLAPGVRFAPHDLDKSIVVLPSTTGMAQQYAPTSLAQGGTTAAPDLMTAGQNYFPTAVAGTNYALAVGERGTPNQVLFYNQQLIQNTLPQGSASSTFTFEAAPSSIAAAGVYRNDAAQGTFTDEFIYVATIDGLIHQFKKDGSPILDSSLDPNATELPPIQTHSPQKLFVKAYRGRLYVVRPIDHEVTSYAIKNEGNNQGELPPPDNGRLLDSTSQSAQTGRDPAAITLLNTSPNAGAAQTTIR